LLLRQSKAKFIAKMYLGRRIFSILIVLLLVSTSHLEAQQFKVKTVVIDAGHGGHDSGCLGHKGSKEKNVTLAVALKIGKLIESNLADVKVIYTRTTDVFVELKERAAIANRNQADLFISIHCNAASNSSAYGAETYFLGLHKSEANLEVAKRENSVITLETNYQDSYNGFDPNSPEWHIAMALNVSAFMEQSSLISQNIQDQYVNHLQRNDRGVKQAGFLVLHQTTMPSILTELGFLTNPAEEAFLTSAEGQGAVSKAIFNAFVKYKNTIEGSKIDVNLAYDQPGEIVSEQIAHPPAPTPVIAIKDTTVEQKPVAVIPAVPPDKPKYKTLMINKQKIWAIKDILPRNSTSFMVQLMAATSLSESQKSMLNKVELLCYEEMTNGINRYIAGPVYTQQEANSLKKKMQSLGFKDAFFAVYKNGERLSPEEVKKYLTAN